MIFELSEICHNCGIYCILVNTFGLFAKIFCDFGEKFVTMDTDGEPE